MVGACGKCREEERCIHSFYGETRGRGATLKTWLYLGENCKMYLKEVGWEDVGLMDPAQDRVKQRAVVSMVMNLSTQCHFSLDQNHNIALPTKRTSSPTLSRGRSMLGL
jgi:hypothetical protein